MQKCFFIFLMLCPFVCKSFADEGANFLTLPVTTELQRVLHGSPVAEPPEDNAQQLRAHVLIDGVSLIDENGKVVSDAIDADALRASLSPYKDLKNGVVNFQVLYQSSGNREAVKKIGDRLTKFGNDAGFHKTRTMSTYRGSRYDWREFMTRIEFTGDDKGQVENSTGDEFIRVYPVRTRLSRYLAGNSDIVVDVRRVARKDAQESLMPQLRSALKKHLAKIEFDNVDGMSKLMIRIEYERDAKEFANWLAENSNDELGPELGFQRVSINMRSR